MCRFILLLTVLFARVAFADDGRLDVRIVDQAGRSLPCRAWVESGGKHYFDPDSPESVTPYPKDRSFSCDGSFQITVPTGDAVIHVEKGKEHLPVRVPVVVGRSVLSKEIRLSRWIDMPSEGWYSADLHVHFGYDDLRVLTQLALADDLHLIPAFTYWLTGRGQWNAAWPGDEFTTPLAIDEHHLVTRNNLEIERISNQSPPGASVGATFLFNLNRPVTAPSFGQYHPSDAALCRIARLDSPNSVFDSDKPSWAETVVGAALGQLDTIQVCHNHYHRLVSLRGGFGMIGPLAPGESNAVVGDGLFHRTNALYYRLLNCGFRLGVSGGSAIGVMPVPAGYNRTYAQVDGKLSAEKLWASIKAGKTFATSGPMVALSVDDQGIGATLRIDEADKPLQVTASVRSIERIESLEIVHNGRIVANRNLLNETPDPTLNSRLEMAVLPRRSGWIAARALYRAPDGLLRQAHTSPVYVLVNDQPIAFADDIRYMLRWLNRLDEVAWQSGRFPTAEARNAVLSVYAEARGRYEAILRSVP